MGGFNRSFIMVLSISLSAYTSLLAFALLIIWYCSSLLIIPSSFSLYSDRSPPVYPNNDREDYSSEDDSDIDYPDSYHSHGMSGNNVKGNGDSATMIQSMDRVVKKGLCLMPTICYILW